MPARKASWYFGWAVLFVLGAALFFVFYGGGLRKILSDQSSSFQVELVRTQIRAHRNASILMIGNSTAAEGFRTNDFNKNAQGRVALNLAVPSGHIYFFQSAYEMARREGIQPKTIVLMVTPEILSLRPDFDFLLNDLILLKTELSAHDLIQIAAHTANPSRYIEYASRIALRPVLFRADIRDFLMHPQERLAAADRTLQWLETFGPESPMPETDNKESVCDAGPLDQLPETAKRLRAEGNTARAAYIDFVQLGYAARIHQPLHVDSFELARFERVLHQMVDSGTKVFLIEAPFYDPEFTQYPEAYRNAASQGFRAAAAHVPGVTVLDPFSADCRLMYDTVHLNRTGGEQFTEYLRTRVL